MDAAEIRRVLERAEALRDWLIADRKRIDALARAIADEAWHARLPEAAPDEGEAREFSREAAALEREIEDEMRRLSGWLATRAERTGT